MPGDHLAASPPLLPTTRQWNVTPPSTHHTLPTHTLPPLPATGAPSNTWCWFLSRVCTPPHSFLSCSRVALSNSPATSPRGRLPEKQERTNTHSPCYQKGMVDSPCYQKGMVDSPYYQKGMGEEAWCYSYCCPRSCTHLPSARGHLPPPPASARPAEGGTAGGPLLPWKQYGPSGAGPLGCSSVRESTTWALA